MHTCMCFQVTDLCPRSEASFQTLLHTFLAKSQKQRAMPGATRVCPCSEAHQSRELGPVVGSFVPICCCLWFAPPFFWGGVAVQIPGPMLIPRDLLRRCQRPAGRRHKEPECKFRPLSSHTHTCTCAHTHTHTLTHPLTHTHTLTHSLTHTRVLTLRMRCRSTSTQSLACL